MHIIDRPTDTPSTAARQIYNMRELSAHTAKVMGAIAESGEPALITLRGRFVAVITPLVDGELERRLINAALEQGAADVDQVLEEIAPKPTGVLAEELGIDMSAPADHDPSD